MPSEKPRKTTLDWLLGGGSYPQTSMPAPAYGTVFFGSAQGFAGPGYEPAQPSLLYFKLEGRTPVKCDQQSWAESLPDLETRRVAMTRVGRHIVVSTLFTGLDNRFNKEIGEPQLFETAIMGGDLNGQTQRYATWEEAERGHVDMVARAKAEAKKIDPQMGL